MSDSRGTGIGAVAAALAGLLTLSPALPEIEGPPPPPAPFLFQDITVASGGTLDFGRPVSDVEKATGAWVDTDGDGWDDLITLTGSGFPFGYFMNRPDGNGGRVLVPAPPGHGLDSGGPLACDGAAITAGDVDGDGDEDLFIGIGWNPNLPWGRNMLLLNDGRGNFTDATLDAGLLDEFNSTCACVFFDMDLDGDLDLFTVATDGPMVEKYGDGRARLWRNEWSETGALHFTDDADRRGVVEDGKACWDAMAPDVDGDGAPDLLFGHDFEGPTQLLRNYGTGYFADVSAVSGSGPGDDSDPSTFGDDTAAAMGNVAADYDNDGDIDLFLTDTNSNALYRNNGDGTFRESALSAGVRPVGVGWGCNFEDFDLDGHLDLYVAEGDFWNAAHPHLRSDCYHSLGDGTFEEVWETAGFLRDPVLHREQGTACADFDGDGRVDLLVVLAERAGAPPYLYRNLTDVGTNRWIGLRLRGNGTTSNTSALGARVRIVPRDASGAAIPGIAQLRELEGSVGRGARSSLTQIVGLGPLAVTADVEVTWPRAGSLASRRNLYTGLPLDRVSTLTDDVPAHPVLPAGGEAVVPGGRTTGIPLPAASGGAAPGSVVVESGPAWCTAVDDGAGGWLLRLVPPAVGAEVDLDVVLLGSMPGVPGTSSRQTLGVRVLPVPELLQVVPRKRGRQLRIRGWNFPPGATTLLVDGVPVVADLRRKQGDRPEDGTSIRLLARLGGRAALTRGTHDVAIREDAGGFVSDPLRILVYGGPDPRRR